jgi:hypothetical protein
MTDDVSFSGKGVIQHFVDAGVAASKDDLGTATVEAATGFVKAVVKAGQIILTGSSGN